MYVDIILYIKTKKTSWNLLHLWTRLYDCAPCLN